MFLYLINIAYYYITYLFLKKRIKFMIIRKLRCLKKSTYDFLNVSLRLLECYNCFHLRLFECNLRIMKI